MKNNTILLFLGLFLSGGQIVTTDSVIEFNTDLGQARMIEIMHTGPQGLVSSYKNIKYAETLNLEEDLNRSDFVTMFDCNLKIGANFLSDAFDKLISPKEQSSLLHDRQHGIVTICKHKQLRKELAKLLEQAAEHEAVVVNFLQHKQEVLENLPEGYWSRTIAKSPVAQMSRQFATAVPVMISLYLLIKIAPWYQYFYKNPADLIKDKKPEDFIQEADIKALDSSPVLKQAEADWNKAQSPYQAVQAFLKGARCDEFMNLYKKAPDSFMNEYIKIEKMIEKLNPAKSINPFAPMNQEVYLHARLAFDIGSALIYGLAYGFVSSNIWTVGSGSYKLYGIHAQDLKIRDALYAINQLIDIAEQIEKLCKAHGIKNQFVMSSIQDKESLSLINSLKAYRYGNNTSSFVATPLVRTFMYEVYEKDMSLAPVFAAIAEADALHAIADTMVQHQYSKNKFCFASIVNQDKPMVHATEFWNVLVKNAVANSMETDRNVILTGPNAGGKSTSIRAILQNIVFAQTFGFAAANEFSITQFDVVHSFINVSDDILNGLSLFATEIKRAQEIMIRIKALPCDQKYFFALDELFTGTNAQDGEMCACSFIKKIANYDNIQFVYATHFDRLKELGATNHHCINYKIDAPAQDEHGKFIRNSKGKLLYPFTLSLGANNISVAQEIARDAGLL